MGCACNCWQSRKRRWCKHVNDDEGVAEGTVVVVPVDDVSKAGDVGGRAAVAPDGTVVVAVAKSFGTDGEFEAGNDDDDDENDDEEEDDDEDELDVWLTEELLKPLLLFWYTVAAAAATFSGVLGTCKKRTEGEQSKIVRTNEHNEYEDRIL